MSRNPGVSTAVGLFEFLANKPGAVTWRGLRVHVGGHEFRGTGILDKLPHFGTWIFCNKIKLGMCAACVSMGRLGFLAAAGLLPGPGRNSNALLQTGRYLQLLKPSLW